MFITDDIKYVGVNDKEIDLFEGQYEVPLGMAYNSYVILDDMCCVLDSVDRRFSREWLDKIASALEGRSPDYLIVQHMEPDHSSSILDFSEKYPECVIVASKKAHAMIDAFFEGKVKAERLAVGENDTLALGRHTLRFITAPMVHWPEVIVTYDECDKVLFSADGFGKFGALDFDDEWACEARRYYFGIVGKYGAQVQALLKKVSALDLRIICPLHGPVLSENLSYYINLYDTWSSYRPEDEGIVIAYTSVYGNTRGAVDYLAKALTERGCAPSSVIDLARCDMAEAVEDAFRYSKLVLATTTYNGDVFPFMKEFINHLTERGFKNRTVALVQNGSWAPMAGKVMAKMLEGSQLTLCETVPTVNCALNDKSRAELDALADELTK
ncbi:MAG: FprA family A-type flavoprotein [Clostridia bacterium]|nr:FprA family A-type flavoprotein [Clostridia bacterium]